jgi:hypothetical protein
MTGLPDEGRSDDDLTERVLVEKVNTTIDLMGEALPGCPKVNKLFLGAQKLSRIHILYLMCSEEAAEWLHKDDVKKSFIDHYSTPILFRNDGYPLIMEYVPVSFDPNLHAIRVLEILNELGANAISEARYLKDPTKRAPNQKTTFLCMTLGMFSIANKIIHEGIIIEGKKVFGRKDIPEAHHCMKCQGFTHRHVAANCPQIHDSCALCSNMHKTSECPSSNTRIYCVNCRQEGHTASSFNCPIFKAECEKIKLHFPKNKYCFFPVINDPSSWQLLMSSQDSTTASAPQPSPPTHNQATNPVNAWNGGPRHPQVGRANRQRGHQFTPPTRDQGWPHNNLSQPGNPGRMQVINPMNSINPASTQSTLRNWLQSPRVSFQLMQPPPPNATTCTVAVFTAMASFMTQSVLPSLQIDSTFIFQ